MLSAQGKNGRLLAAWEAKPSDGPFLCPGCKQGAILKKGHIKTHHFAHAPGEFCPYWEYHRGESQVHLGAKNVHGPLGEIPLFYAPHSFWFTELEIDNSDA